VITDKSKTIIEIGFLHNSFFLELMALPLFLNMIMQIFQLLQYYDSLRSAIPLWIALRRIKAPHSLLKKYLAKSFA